MKFSSYISTNMYSYWPGRITIIPGRRSSLFRDNNKHTICHLQSGKCVQWIKIQLYSISMWIWLESEHLLNTVTRVQEYKSCWNHFESRTFFLLRPMSGVVQTIDFIGTWNRDTVLSSSMICHHLPLRSRFPHRGIVVG